MKIENSLHKYVPTNMRNQAKQYLYADLIKISEKLRCEISLEKDPFIMLEKSLLCISVLTNEFLFYEHNRDKLIKIIANWETKENL